MMMLTPQDVTNIEDYYRSYLPTDGEAKTIRALVEYIRALESQAAQGTDGVHPVVRVTSYGMYEIIGPDGQIIATVESEKTADSIAKAIVFGPIAAPGKVVAGEGFKARLATAIENVTRTTIQADNGGCDGADVYEATCAQEVLDELLGELVELPAPLRTKQDPDENNLITVFDDDAFPLAHVYPKDAMRIAAALIAAATQPQKGKG